MTSLQLTVRTCFITRRVLQEQKQNSKLKKKSKQIFSLYFSSKMHRERILALYQNLTKNINSDLALYMFFIKNEQLLLHTFLHR